MFFCSKFNVLTKSDQTEGISVTDKDSTGGWSDIGSSICVVFPCAHHILLVLASYIVS